MKIKNKKYDANFTAGGILFNEFKSLEDILLSENFELYILKEEQENNVIGIATNSARKRIISEIKRRYNYTEPDFWRHFFKWPEIEQKMALFYLCLKAYPVILDIHFEVTIKKFKAGDKLDAYDVQMRLDELASNDNDVAKWSKSTFSKINVQYRKALKDVCLFDGDRLTRNLKVTDQFWNFFNDNKEFWFLEACFKN
tara:strand:- start:262 stop:855 length:594 start_codon:yes stop_codon:yes gene_type:complete